MELCKSLEKRLANLKKVGDHMDMELSILLAEKQGMWIVGGEEDTFISVDELPKTILLSFGETEEEKEKENNAKTLYIFDKSKLVGCVYTNWIIPK